MSATFSESTAKGIAKLVRKLATNFDGNAFDGEVLNTVNGIRKKLTSAGLSFNDIAVVIENARSEDTEERTYSAAEAKMAFDRGVEKGRRENRGRTLAIDFFDEDGEPRWLEIVRYCEKNPNGASLGPKERDMIDEMPSKLQRWHAPTRAGGGFLLSIFWKCRGSFL